jgi:hypothetical protein
VKEKLESWNYQHARCAWSKPSFTSRQSPLPDVLTWATWCRRMDANVTGLVTVQCSHTFHCMCLKGWANNNCPVCRYTQGRTKNDKSWQGQLANSCAVCTNTEVRRHMRYSVIYDLIPPCVASLDVPGLRTCGLWSIFREARLRAL